MKQTAYNEQPTPGTPPGIKTTDENTKGAREKGGGRVFNSLLNRFTYVRVHTYIKSTQFKFSTKNGFYPPYLPLQSLFNYLLLMVSFGTRNRTFRMTHLQWLSTISSFLSPWQSLTLYGLSFRPRCGNTSLFLTWSAAVWHIVKNETGF